jgi:predicted RNase H-related nuclease YkuK (DUF458 family)
VERHSGIASGARTNTIDMLDQITGCWAAEGIEDNIDPFAPR